MSFIELIVFLFRLEMFFVKGVLILCFILKRKLEFAALVSPWGVFAIEVKNRSGTSEYSGSDFCEKRKSGYENVADDSNPIKQARRNAAALKEFLDPDFNRNKEHTFVEPIVVWANPEIKVYRKKPAEPQDPHGQETKCWRIEDLSFELDSIRCKKHLSEKARREIIKKLEGCY